MAVLNVSANDTYTMISAALIVAQSGDTILINDSRTYIESWNDANIAGITIKSNITDPDLFPVLKIDMNQNTQNNSSDVTFEGVIFNQNRSFFSYNNNNFRFKRCFFDGYSNIISCNFDRASVTSFESCIFTNISQYVIDGSKNFNEGGVIFSNCTFHNCTAVIGNNFTNINYVSKLGFRNCLFTSCQLMPDVSDSYRGTLLQVIKYSVFTDDPTEAGEYLGSACSVNVSISDIYAKTSKSVPTDFQLKEISDSKVINKGDNNLGYGYDIANRQRVGTYDIGAWESDATTSSESSGNDNTTDKTWGVSYWII